MFRLVRAVGADVFMYLSLELRIELVACACLVEAGWVCVLVAQVAADACGSCVGS